MKMIMLMMMIKQRLQGFSHLSSSGHIGDWEESSSGIAVRIVGASCCGQTGGQLGGSEGRSHKGENHEGSHFVSEGISQSCQDNIVVQFVVVI